MRGAERGAGAAPHRAGGEPEAARHRALRNPGGERELDGHRDSRQRGAAAGGRNACKAAEEQRRERGAAVREPRNQPRPRPCPSLRPARGGEE